MTVKNAEKKNTETPQAQVFYPSQENPKVQSESFSDEEGIKAAKKASSPSEEELIQMILQMRIRPVLQSHGGDISFVGFKDGIVSVKLLGACDGCPHALETIKNNVEGFLKVLLPGVKSVRDISNDGENN